MVFLEEITNKRKGGDFLGRGSEGGGEWEPKHHNATIVATVLDRGPMENTTGKPQDHWKTAITSSHNPFLDEAGKAAGRAFVKDLSPDWLCLPETRAQFLAVLSALGRKMNG